MEVMEIIKESLTYPFNNIAGMLLYIVLAIISAIILSGTVVSSVFASKGSFVGIILSIIGAVVSILLFLVIDGYGLDIIKLGIDRSDAPPSIDIIRQATSGLKLTIVQIIYFLIPLIIYIMLLMILATWLATLIFIILVIVFALIETMGTCRLAVTDDISSALAVDQCFGDLVSIGFINLIAIVVAFVVIFAIISCLISFIFGQTSTITLILNAILSVYFLFASNRAIGLLYSNA